MKRSTWLRDEKEKNNPYKEANEAFLAEKAKEEGIVVLFMVGDLIMGWQIALTRMHEGDKWEVYIPAKWGYGAMKMDDIPAHSTLIFTLQLVKIER